MFRTIVGVIVGYAVFGISATALFQLTHQKPHAAASMGFMAASIAYGVAFALLGGYVAALIAKRSGGAIAVGVIIALGAIISMLAQPALPKWSPIGALALMAPAAALGGMVRKSKVPA